MYHQTRYNALPLRSNLPVASLAAPKATQGHPIGQRESRVGSRSISRSLLVLLSRVAGSKASDCERCNFDSEKGERGRGYEVPSLLRPWWIRS